MRRTIPASPSGTRSPRAATRAATRVTAPLALATLALAGACARQPQVDEGGGGGQAVVPRQGPPSRLVATGSLDAQAVYRQLGLLAAPDPVPFVGRVSFLGSRRPDSTLALVTVTFANRALTFQREDDRYRASYSLEVEIRRDSGAVRRLTTTETVRVGTFRETTRVDESVVYQDGVVLAPGAYTITAAVRDVGGARGSTATARLVVPRIGAGGVSSPVVAFEAAPRFTLDSMPRVVATARGTFVFGRDSTVPVYVEAYGAPAASGAAAQVPDAGAPVILTARGERDAVLWADTTRLVRRGAFYGGVVRVPVSRLGVGVSQLTATRAGSPDSTRAPLFVTFGEELPVASFEEVLTYLRYFASPTRLAALRSAPLDARATAWADFVRATDPTPDSPPNEAIAAYFGRIAIANDRFRNEGGSGWQTDRGMVYVALGDPDQIYEQGGVGSSTSDMGQRGRVQAWEYRDAGIRLVFVDQNGFGRWRLTPSSNSEFEAAARRRQAR